MKCEKCGAVSGDDWSQCNGSCPMVASPHYVGERAALAETFTQPKITGYRQLSQAEADLMNKIKFYGVDIESLITEVEAHLVAQNRANTGPLEAERLAKTQPFRWVAIARTDFQTALMALTRAVAQPSSF